MSPTPSTPTSARDEVRKVAPKLIELTEKVLYGDVWERPGLSKRDRSLITVAALIAMYRTDQLKGHIERALANGVTHEEIGELITHLAFYAGWPGAMSAAQHRDEGLRGEEGMKVGFIGLGTMGASMASNLQKGGHELVVHDMRREAAAPHLAAGADLGRHARARWRRRRGGLHLAARARRRWRRSRSAPDGLIHGMQQGQGLLRPDAPTRPRWCAGSTPAFKEKGIHVLDAPVSGGPKGAKRGKLALWVGGDREVYDRFKPVLDAIGDQPYYVGPIGAGSVAKLVHNCAGYAMQTALAEVFTMGVKAGVDPLDAVEGGAPGRGRPAPHLRRRWPISSCPTSSTRPRSPAAGPQGRLAGDGLARELSVPMRLANLTLEELTEALNRGWGERDSRVSMLLQEERAGVKIAVPVEQIREVLDTLRAASPRCATCASAAPGCRCRASVSAP